MNLTADLLDKDKIFTKKVVKTLTFTVNEKMKPDANAYKQITDDMTEKLLKTKWFLLVTGPCGTVALFRGVFRTIQTSEMELLAKIFND